MVARVKAEAIEGMYDKLETVEEILYRIAATKGKDVPGSMMFADDIVICDDDETDMTEYLEIWRKALDERGTRISRPKTQFMDFNFGQYKGQEREPVKILGEELQRVHHFKHLGSSVEET